ncbi:peptide chain release factor N(5)-glutamine methyltransferase [Simiduia curdlanivorans]|uniref:Release factor glutamine methyltransferase n=1 Tax=Simiduia curdlanivorans TaxID=1492769 RepID=A0ABV8V4M0_9GAMM|nr:peptide chain release factor N(5)-glutamine methyltransferase [Simiduia curdlanivorans]MDN3638395.1 peptide chain release factor N(5)-glutamine methyltransferase [Simiduia curdlanivorans]
MPTIKAALSQASAIASDSARLDAELLLCHALGKPRTYLYTWPEAQLSDQQASNFNELLSRRKFGEPIAHILGYREFWSLPLKVNASTLIPRPATEALIEWVLTQPFPSDCELLDLGTGTGAIALALGSEKPQWQITGLDLSTDAVALAQENAQSLQIANCQFATSDWFSAIQDQHYDLIISNPPYIDAQDPHLQQGDVRFEPLSALVAEENGLADLRRIINNAINYLKVDATLVLEHGYQQANEVRHMLLAAGFSQVSSGIDLDGHERFSFGRWRESQHER